MLRRLADSEEGANDNWLQAYVAGDYFDKVSRGHFNGDSKSFSLSLGYNAEDLVC